MPSSITIKELHATTGAHVRRAGEGRAPVVVTYRGEAVAVLANPSLIKATPRRRTILPEYAAMMARNRSNDVLDDLDAVRGDR